MSSLSSSDSTLCGAGAEGKTGEELLDHFREFVRKVWDSESLPGLVLVLRPTLIKADTEWHVELKSEQKSYENTVYFFTVAQWKCLAPKSYEEVRIKADRDSRKPRAVLVKLMDVSGSHKRLEVEKRIRKATLVKWFANLQQIGDECVMCYEETGPTKKASICFICAANVCLQCTVDIALDSKPIEDIRTIRCPLCAAELEMSFSDLFDTAEAGNTLPEAYKEFAIFWNCNCFLLGGLSKALGCDFTKMTAKMREAIEIGFEAHMRKILESYETHVKESHSKKDTIRRKVVDARKHLETCVARVQRALRECDAVKVKTEVKSASDDSIASGSAVPKRVRSDRCARCQKVFWDKKEKKRAPKCPKCKRVAYCSGACRKKHKRAHSLQCVAGAKAKKQKKAAAKAAKLHGR